MSESAWMCKGCGLVFQWTRAINMAIYAQGGEETNKYVLGDTRPSGCPECEQDEVEVLEG